MVMTSPQVAQRTPSIGSRRSCPRSTSSLRELAWGQVPATKDPKSASKEKPSYYSPVSVDQDGAYKPTTAPASNWPAHGAKGGAKKSKPPAAPSVTRCEFDGETLEVSWTDHNNNSDTWSLEYAPTWWHEVRTR